MLQYPLWGLSPTMTQTVVGSQDRLQRKGTTAEKKAFKDVGSLGTGEEVNHLAEAAVDCYSAEEEAGDYSEEEEAGEESGLEEAVDYSGAEEAGEESVVYSSAVEEAVDY